MQIVGSRSTLGLLKPLFTDNPERYTWRQQAITQAEKKFSQLGATRYSKGYAGRMTQPAANDAYSLFLDGYHECRPIGDHELAFLYKFSHYSCSISCICPALCNKFVYWIPEVCDANLWGPAPPAPRPRTTWHEICLIPCILSQISGIPWVLYKTL